MKTKTSWSLANISDDVINIHNGGSNVSNGRSSIQFVIEKEVEPRDSICEILEFSMVQKIVSCCLNAVKIYKKNRKVIWLCKSL